MRELRAKSYAESREKMGEQRLPVRPNAVRLEQFDVIVIERLDLEAGLHAHLERRYKYVIM
jgi:hypothetical protein